MAIIKKTDNKKSIDIDDIITKVTVPSDIMDDVIKRISTIQKTINKFRIKRGLHSEKKSKSEIIAQEFILEIKKIFSNSKVSFYELFNRLTKDQFEKKYSENSESSYNNINKLLEIKTRIEEFGSKIKSESIIEKIVHNNNFLTSKEIKTAENIINNITPYNYKTDKIEKIETLLEGNLKFYGCYTDDYVNKIKVNILKKLKKNSEIGSSIKKAKKRLKREIKSDETQIKYDYNQLKESYNLLLESQITIQDVYDAIKVIDNIKEKVESSEEEKKSGMLTALEQLREIFINISDKLKLTAEDIKILDTILKKKKPKDNFTEEESETIENVLNSIKSLCDKYNSKVTKASYKQSTVMCYSKDMRKELNEKISNDVVYVLAFAQYFSGTVGIEKIQKDVKKIEEYIIKHKLTISTFGEGIIPHIDSNNIPDFIIDKDQINIRYLDFISFKLLNITKDYNVEYYKLKTLKDKIKKTKKDANNYKICETCINSLKANKQNICGFEPNIKSLIKKYPKFTKILERKVEDLFKDNSKYKAQLDILMVNYYNTMYSLKYGSSSTALHAMNSAIDEWEDSIFEFIYIIENYPKINDVETKLKEIFAKKKGYNEIKDNNYDEKKKDIKPSKNNSSTSDFNYEKFIQLSIDLAKCSEELEEKFEDFNKCIEELKKQEKTSYKALKVFKILSQTIIIAFAIIKGSVTLCVKGKNLNCNASAFGKNFTLR